MIGRKNVTGLNPVRRAGLGRSQRRRRIEVRIENPALNVHAASATAAKREGARIFLPNDGKKVFADCAVGGKGSAAQAEEGDANRPNHNRQFV